MVSKRLGVVLGTALAVVSFTAGTATAGHERCGGACYAKVYSPPVYGQIRQQVMVHPAVAIRHVTPATFAVVHERVLVSPAQVGWVRKSDHHGREIICKVVTPARYGTVARQVMVRPPQASYTVRPAQYVTETRTVQLQGARSAWVPVGHHGRHHRHWD